MSTSGSILLWVLSAIVASVIGYKKNRLLLGIILGVAIGAIGAIILAFMTKKEKNSELEKSEKDPE